MIRSLLLSSVASLALATSALAADLPNVKGPPVFAPPPPPVFSWSGVYIGGQVGYEWGDTRASTFFPGGASAFPIGHRDEGVVGGAHIGYNYQVSQFVFGVEGDVNGSGYEGSGISPAGVFADRTRIPVDGSVRGRLGIAFDRVLVYGTGGVAFASIRNSFSNLVTGAFDEDQTGRIGWTVGGGIEYAVDNNWSIRAEYRYTDYGSYGYTLFNSTFAPLNLRARETDSRATVGFSYKFDMFAPPAPIVAKY